MKLFVFPNLNKKNCADYTLQACEILIKNGVEVFISDRYKDEFSQLDEIKFVKENAILFLL